VLSSAYDIHLDAEFYPIPPEEVDFSISTNPSGAGIIYDDPDSRVWNIDKDTIDRSITVTTQPGFSF
jgi:hypothetical protein